MHLSPEFGLTVHEFERDGFAIARRVEMLVSSDNRRRRREVDRPSIMVCRTHSSTCSPTSSWCWRPVRDPGGGRGLPCARHPLATSRGDTTEALDNRSVTPSPRWRTCTSFQTTSTRVRQLGEDPAESTFAARGSTTAAPAAAHAAAELEQALGACSDRATSADLPSCDAGADHGRSQLDELLAALDVWRPTRLSG